MEVIKIDEIPAQKSPRGPKTRKVLSHPSVAVTEVILDAGEELPPHKTPVDVFFYVRSGSGQVSIGDEEQDVSAGDVIFSPKNIPHGLKASGKPDASRGSKDGQERFGVLVVKAPNPVYGG